MTPVPKPQKRRRRTAAGRSDRARKGFGADQANIANADWSDDERRVGTTLDRSAIEQRRFHKFLSENFPKLKLSMVAARFTAATVRTAVRLGKIEETYPGAA
jgi:hypothetical protein